MARRGGIEPEADREGDRPTSSITGTIATMASRFEKKRALHTSQ